MACYEAGDVGCRMMEVLLQHGASPNALEGDDACVGGPLHIAAKRSCAAAVETLLAHGADPNTCDSKGCTPLHVLCAQAYFHGFVEHQRCLNLLLASGARPHVVDNS